MELIWTFRNGKIRGERITQKINKIVFPSREEECCIGHRVEVEIVGDTRPDDPNKGAYIAKQIKCLTCELLNREWGHIQFAGGSILKVAEMYHAVYDIHKEAEYVEAIYEGAYHEAPCRPSNHGIKPINLVDASTVEELDYNSKLLHYYEQMEGVLFSWWLSLDVVSRASYMWKQGKFVLSHYISYEGKDWKRIVSILSGYPVYSLNYELLKWSPTCESLLVPEYTSWADRPLIMKN